MSWDQYIINGEPLYIVSWRIWMIYMALGCILMFVLEYTFAQLGDSGKKLTTKEKIAGVAGWPVVLYFLIKVLTEKNEDDEKL